MDKTAKVTKPKGKEYCDKPGTSCYYGPDDICVNCGRKKGWRQMNEKDKQLIDEIKTAAHDTEHDALMSLLDVMTQSIDKVHKGSMDNDKAILELCNKMIERIIKLEQAVSTLSEVVQRLSIYRVQ